MQPSLNPQDSSHSLAHSSRFYALNVHKGSQYPTPIIHQPPRPLFSTDPFQESLTTSPHPPRQPLHQQASRLLSRPPMSFVHPMVTPISLRQSRALLDHDEPLLSPSLACGVALIASVHFDDLGV